MSDRKQGMVLRRRGASLEVSVGAGILRCTLSGKLRHDRKASTAPAVVGDHVEVTEGEGGEGVIEKVLPRRSRLSRPDTQDADREAVIVANADLLLIVQAVSSPEFDPHVIDRSLVMAEAGGLSAAICVNKRDLVSAAEVDRAVEVYRALGYTVILASARTREGLPSLADLVAGKVTVLFGPSGVGKSSLLNALDPALGLKVGGLSEKTQEGKHTTTWAELVALSGGGHVVDTPGVEVFGLWGVNETDLVQHFPEFLKHLGECKFNDCFHAAEPGCRIRGLVGSEVSPRRYESYLKMLRGMRKGRR